MESVFSCSLDDGYPSDMKVMELLRKYGINATFYIPARNSEGHRVISKENLRELAAEFEIGGHTYDHYYLKGLPAEEVLYQVREGKKYLEDILGKEISGFCYPGGKYHVNQLSLIRSAGFKYARTTMNLRFEAGNSPYEIPTTLQFYPHHKDVYLRNFVKAGNWKQRREGFRLVMLSKDWIDAIYALFESSVVHGQVFHLWGHSKEIDEFHGWAQFERFLRHVQECTRPINRLSNADLALRYLNIHSAA